MNEKYSIVEWPWTSVWIGMKYMEIDKHELVHKKVPVVVSKDLKLQMDHSKKEGLHGEGWREPLKAFEPGVISSDLHKL